ncbi:MAG: histone deacetylase family protein [Anaerolineales bacterium]|uniref:histone deacetylase family protein n=1 Tax=Candidatus Villigracilis proximus TaxID=3140683 RepID=UPI00313606B5|nr:histone deacetylase family protein [Anaerolineales bacterium]
MKIFYSEEHRKHYPPFEVFDGGKRVPYYENPDRMDKILSALKKTDWAEFIAPVDFGLAPIYATHDEGYIQFLASAWTEWLASDPEIAAAPEQNAFLPATFALRRTPRVPSTLLGKAGYYMMDLSACIMGATYEAALASANCALNAAQEAVNSQRSAFGLCRPPGHHAGKDYAGGYCFINNASVAANWLSAKGKVALLDIDYHAGNGTQDIFYERDDVLTISIHGDPDYEYPHYVGFADETGAGAGLGFHKNFPLPKDTDDEGYLSALDEAITMIKNFAPNYLILSAGMDTFKDDPLGTFKVTREGFRKIGKRIADLNLPTVIIMEGGYANEALGTNVVTLLENFK